MTPETVRALYSAQEEITQAWLEYLGHQNASLIEAVIELVVEFGEDDLDERFYRHTRDAHLVDLQTIRADITRRESD